MSKPSWEQIESRYNFLAGDYLGYTLWSEEPYKLATSSGYQWACDWAKSFGNIPDFDPNRVPFVERRP